jgi:hypothetical protein
MKLQEIIDVITKRHPGTSGNQVTRLANRAIQDFCTKTELIEDSFSLDGGTVPNQRWYDLPDEIIKIKSIDIDDETAPMLVGRPEKRDIT